MSRPNVKVTREDFERLLGKDACSGAPWHCLLNLFHKRPEEVGADSFPYYCEKDVSRMARWLTNYVRGGDKELVDLVGAACVLAKSMSNQEVGRLETDIAAALLLANVGQFLIRIQPEKDRAKAKPKRIADQTAQSSEPLRGLARAMRRQAKRPAKKRAA